MQKMTQITHLTFILKIFFLIYNIVCTLYNIFIKMDKWHNLTFLLFAANKTLNSSLQLYVFVESAVPQGRRCVVSPKFHAIFRF